MSKYCLVSNTRILTWGYNIKLIQTRLEAIQKALSSLATTSWNICTLLPSRKKMVFQVREILKKGSLFLKTRKFSATPGGFILFLRESNEMSWGIQWKSAPETRNKSSDTSICWVWSFQMCVQRRPCTLWKKCVKCHTMSHWDIPICHFFTIWHISQSPSAALISVLTQSYVWKMCLDENNSWLVMGFSGGTFSEILYLIGENTLIRPCNLYPGAIHLHRHESLFTYKNTYEGLLRPLS